MGFGGRPGKLSTPKLLVVAQIALSFSLLVAAGLFLQSFRKLDQVDPGFDHDHLLEFNISFLEASGYKGEAIYRVHREMLTRLAAIPQVRGATLAFMGLFVGNDMGSHISIDGSTPKPDPANLVRNDFVPAHHFAAIGQRLLMGREFTAEDERSAQLVGIVDQRLATKFFGEANPLGKTIRFDHDHPRDFVVIGVVANAKHNSLRERDDGEFWLPFFNASGDEPSSCTFQVRYTGSDAPVAAAIRAAVKDVAPAVGPIEIQTMNRLMSATLIAERAVSDISSAFGFIALLLAAIGLYGVMYHSLTARMTELGIRLALGARPGQILRAVLGETVALIVAGVAAGVPLLLAVKGWLSSQLFGLTAFDPTIVGVAICVLTASTALAGYVPARWASRVDPMVTLHYE
jgi:predicted permease